MTYTETLEFLYHQLPMFTRIGAAAYKKDLHNTLALLEILGNPHKKFKSIHVAGTNGKGSTSHMLASVLHAHGYKTALYTSPHLRDFRERIKISGQQNLEMISEDFVVDFTRQMLPHIETIQPSFFELTVAMAFSYFAEKQVDIAIIETGLGGRLDSTNVITPLLSIITNIGWDHMNLLGDTLEKIAEEKAGIIKPGVPVVVGETLPETRRVFERKAEEKLAPLVFSEELFQTLTCSLQIDSLSVTYKTGQATLNYTTDLPGIYQQLNLRTVLAALQALAPHFTFNNEIIHFALQHVQALSGLQGRWQVIRRRPFVVLDVGHNEDGVKQVLRQLEQVKGNARVSIVTGMVKDKDVDHILELYPKNYHYYFTNAHIPRAMPVAELQQKAAVMGLIGKSYDNVNQAITDAISESDLDDIVLVCGSVFVVGEVEELKNGLGG